jgi:hypothetical protein
MLVRKGLSLWPHPFFGVASFKSMCFFFFHLIIVRKEVMSTLSITLFSTLAFLLGKIYAGEVTPCYVGPSKMEGPTSVLYNKENLLKIECYRVSVTSHYVFLKRVCPLSFCTCFPLYHLNPTHTLSIPPTTEPRVNRCTSTAFESNCSYIEFVKRYTLFALMILKLEIKLQVEFSVLFDSQYVPIITFCFY